MRDEMMLLLLATPTSTKKIVKNTISRPLWDAGDATPETKTGGVDPIQKLEQH